MIISFCVRKVRRFVNSVLCTRNMYKYGFFLLAAFTILIWIQYSGRSKSLHAYQRYKEKIHVYQGHRHAPAAHGHVLSRLRALIPAPLSHFHYHGGKPFYVLGKRETVILANFGYPRGKTLELTGNNKAKRPVIVMASSKSYFYRTLKTIASVQIRLPKEKIVLYDIGLTRVQHLLASRFCQVEVRRFRFSAYPSHFRLLRTFAWKPIILQKTLQEFGAILWLESPAIITASESSYSKVLEEAKKTGVLLLGGRAPSSVHHYTHPKMMRYLPLRQLKRGFSFQSLVSPMIIYNTKQVHEQFMKWLVYCALDRRCIAPLGGRQRYCKLRYRKIDRKNRIWRRIIRHCHHFDQSAINILLKNMFASSPRAFISKTKISMTKRGRVLRFYKPKLCKKVKH